MIEQQDQFDLIIEADFIWREIQVGDDIYLDDDFYQQDRRLLCKGVPYQVLNKIEDVCGAQTLVVQSYQTRELVAVSPFLVCNFESPEEPFMLS